MDGFRIPLSEIISLAKTQAAQYWLDSYSMSRSDHTSHTDKAQYEAEMTYWDNVGIYLQGLQDRRVIP